MASAAAVGANAALSPPRNDLGEDEGIPGGITSAVGNKEDILGANGELSDEEDDIRNTARRRGPVEAAANGGVNGSVDGEDDGDLGLFGDDDEEAGSNAPAETRVRQLDDEELDSGDDMDRTDRLDAEEATQQVTPDREVMTMDIEIARQPLPEPTDGEMYLLKVPEFMAIEPNSWDHQKFQPPTTDHHSNKPPTATFSAYNTALSTIRWRHSPSDPSSLQSNARILRWSDGSLTLQLASDPTVQYEIAGNPLAPPQRNAIRPTPVSVSAPGSKGGREGDGKIPGERYNQNKDAFTYMVVPHETTETLRVAQKITAGLSIKQTESVTDDAEERLQAAFAHAANANKVEGIDEDALKLMEEDPEKARREAEELMRQKAKADKRREAAALRDTERANRTMGRHGMSSGRFGGLNVGMLEDEDELGAGRPRKVGSTPRKSRQRRNSIYSDDEDFGRKRFATKEDEYDEEDDFLAPSDEEEVVDDDDEDDDDGIVEDDAPARKERARPADATAADEDVDADGEPDDEAPQGPRVKRRRVVDDDDE